MHYPVYNKAPWLLQPGGFKPKPYHQIKYNLSLIGINVPVHE
jgi:hypothetical protein